MMDYKVIPLDKLVDFDLREKRIGTLKRLEERIREGYNPARPLAVIPQDGRYLVVDGSHRLAILKRLGISQVPCVIYPEGTDPYKIAVTSNQDEDTYAPMDLFDWLDIIARLREVGLTQAQIGERIGWSRSAVLNHLQVIDKIDTCVLDLARKHQIGRVSENDTDVAFNFTEGWFRTSGLYDLCGKYQLDFMKRFIAEKCQWRKAKVQKETAKYKRWQEFKEIAKEELVNEDDLPEIEKLIENDAFKTEVQLREKIRDFNEKAQNKLICGDCLIELEKLPDAVIDLVITDPPYGIGYKSNRSPYSDHITKVGIENDDLTRALGLVDRTCQLLVKKTKPDAHLYFFVGWQTEPDFRRVIGRYFDIRNVIIWDKGNHGPGDLEYSWGNRYEMIIFATKGRRKLNKRADDIICIPRVSSDAMIHPAQKPVELIKHLLEVSARKADTVCDPFMGSGSTIKAVKEFGGLNYIGIELDREIFEKARIFIGGDRS